MRYEVVDVRGKEGAWMGVRILHTHPPQNHPPHPYPPHDIQPSLPPTHTPHKNHPPTRTITTQGGHTRGEIRYTPLTHPLTSTTHTMTHTHTQIVRTRWSISSTPSTRRTTWRASGSSAGRRHVSLSLSLYIYISISQSLCGKVEYVCRSGLRIKRGRGVGVWVCVSVCVSVFLETSVHT
jgi:hypothetical protein